MKTKLMLAAGISAAFAAGTLFGPLDLASAGHTNSVLKAKLSGEAEVPTDPAVKGTVGDPDGDGAAFVFGIDNDPLTLCYVLTVDDISAATGAHIHRGTRKQNGPVVANLAAPGDGNAADCLTEGEMGKFPGNPTGIVAEILADPGSFYVNVHTSEFPGGAIRGQLKYER